MTVDISVPFFEVARIYKAKRRVLYWGNDRARAVSLFMATASGMRDGDVLLYEDGAQTNARHCGYMRRHW